MIRNIKARFSKGVLIPQRRLDLEEGKDVLIFIAERPTEHSVEALRATAGAWKGTHDPEALNRAIYSDRNSATRPQPKL